MNSRTSILISFFVLNVFLTITPSLSLQCTVTVNGRVVESEECPSGMGTIIGIIIAVIVIAVVIPIGCCFCCGCLCFKAGQNINNSRTPGVIYTQTEAIGSAPPQYP